MRVQIPPRAQNVSQNCQKNTNRSLRAYIIGLAIGDGNLSNPNNRATRLRITCDKKYPKLMGRIAESFQKLLPKNKIGFVDRKGCVDISVYSNYLENLLGWRVGYGSKAYQKVTVPKWILEGKKSYKIKCLRGLIETDGSIYIDRKYKMVIFSTIIPELARDVYNMIISLGFKPHIYKINRGVHKNNTYLKYQVRLSLCVDNFLKILDLEKK